MRGSERGRRAVSCVFWEKNGAMIGTVVEGMVVGEAARWWRVRRFIGGKLWMCIMNKKRRTTRTTTRSGGIGGEGKHCS